MRSILYLDLFIFNNTIINFVLVFFSVKANKLIANKTRLIIVSVLSSIISAVSLLLNHYVIVVLKITLPFAMCYYSAKKCSAKQLLKLVITFWAHTLILSGVFSALNLSKNFIAINNINFGRISYAAICIAVLIFYLLYKYIFKLLSRQLLDKKIYKTVELLINSTHISLIGFCDSGNSLTDKKSGLPIFVLEQKKLQRHLNLKDIPHRYIKCNTILGYGEIPIIIPDSITIDGINVKALIGLSAYDFSIDYDIILNPIYQFQSSINSFEETENIYV